MDAVNAFDAALALDSGFALAALGLLKAGYWGEGGRLMDASERGERFLQPVRDRLSARDQAYAAAVFWGLFRPAPPHLSVKQHHIWPFREQLALLEHAVNLAPDSPDALFALGLHIWTRAASKKGGSFHRCIGLEFAWRFSLYSVSTGLQ
jgi:hypothetical protein